MQINCTYARLAVIKNNGIDRRVAHLNKEIAFADLGNLLNALPDNIFRVIRLTLCQKIFLSGQTKEKKCKRVNWIILKRS